MVQVIGPGQRKIGFQEQLLGGLERGLDAYSEYQQHNQRQKAMKELGLPPGLPADFAKEVLKHRHDVALQKYESPLQGAQRQKYEAETRQINSEQDYVDQLKGGENQQAPEQTAFNINEPSTWNEKQIDKLKNYKGSNPHLKTLAATAEDEYKKREKTTKENKEKKAVRALLKETGKYNTDEELDEAVDTFDLKTAKALYTEAKKPAAAPKKTEGEKLLEKEVAKGYIDAKNEIPKLEADLQNIQRLRELGKNELSAKKGGHIKSLFNTASAAEYNTLGASLIDRAIKIFNPVGAIPVTKLKWIRETFSPQAGEMQSTQEGKIATIERLTQQSLQRAREKIKLYEDYNGQPPESEVLKFDSESAKLINDFVDDHQYIDQLKKEVPKGKILMLDPAGKPLHVDPNAKGPDGGSLIDFYIQHKARLVQ